MLVQKISIFFTLVGTTSFAFPEFSSLWDQRVFPDDEQVLSAFVERKSKNLMGESNDSKNYEVCETLECKRIAEEFLDSIDKSVNPCDDFYNFACSRWAVNNPIPPSMPSWSRYQMFQKAVDHRVKGILESEPVPGDILPVRQAKKWYHSCMDTESREERGIKPIESILIRAGGWPITMDEEEWDADENTWQQVEDSYVRLTYSYTFFNLHARPPSSKGRKIGDLLITPQDPPFGDNLPLQYRDYSGNDYNEYINLVTGIATMFAERNLADVFKSKIRKEAEEIVEFEKKMFELRQKPELVQMNFEEFLDWYDSNATDSDKYPEGKIDWRSTIQRLFDIVNIKIDPKTNIYLIDLSYIKGIGELLRKTPERTIVNFVHWNFVASMLPYTTEAVKEEIFEYIGWELGIKERPPRWSECVNDMKMADAVALAFVDKYYSKHTENTVRDMLKNIQNEMKMQIEESNWLDAESKILAKEKLANMKMFIGYPDWYKDKKAVLNMYKGLNIGSEYFDNALSYNRFDKKKKLKAYLPPDDGEDDSWLMDPITVNALYSRGDNVLNIPAADVQPPLFTPQLPDYVNYGIIGVIAGHEMGHGFDDKGIKYGKDGNETELSEQILKSYYQRADCFTDQFGEYYGEKRKSESTDATPNDEEKEPSKSLFTRAENIADTTGLQTVFRAYQKLKKPEISLRLPGFEEYTEDQLFFISFGAMWCQAVTPQLEAMMEMEMDDVHSPVKLRVIGAISNTMDFGKVFNCPAGSPMNPANKCSIWEKSDSSTEKKLARLRKKRNRWVGQWKG